MDAKSERKMQSVQNRVLKQRKHKTQTARKLQTNKADKIRVTEGDSTMTSQRQTVSVVARHYLPSVLATLPPDTHVSTIDFNPVLTRKEAVKVESQIAAVQHFRQATGRQVVSST